MTAPIQIRLASRRDARLLIEFNRAMARETEAKELFPEVISAGVRRLLTHSGSGFYLIAEAGGEVAGWRNGDFWWIQSVYVRPEFRRQGVYRRLYRHVQQLAARRPGVCGFRLYVEHDNRRAKAAYRAAGMQQTRYLVFEALKPGIRFFTRTQARRRTRAS
jgi:ribosomal protein S18 acetylase RimI-like enzyme